MDFIEQWFGFSPDGGDGSTEALIIIVALVAVLLGLARFALRRTGWPGPKTAGPAGDK